MTAGSPTLTSLSGSFTPSDVGKYMQVIGAGPGGSSGTGAIALDSNVLTSSSGGFVSSDVGRGIIILGAGPQGADLITSIAACQSPNSVTLNTAAATALTGATYYYGAMTLEATIRSVQSNTTVTLSTSAAATVSSATYAYGTNNAAQFQAAVDSVGQSGGGTVNVPQPATCPAGATCGYVLAATDMTTSVAPSAVKIRYSGVSLVGASPEANLFCRGAWGLYASSVQFGSEPAAIRGHCIGLGDGNGPPGSGISVSDVTLSNLHLYGMTNGNTLSYSFLPTAPPLTTTGDGWDETHKGVYMWGQGAFANIMIDSVSIQDFKGENIFSGGSAVTGMVIQNSNMTNFNGDGISVLAASLQVLNCSITNGSNAGIENAAQGSGAPALISQVYQGNLIANFPREGLVVVGVDGTVPAGTISIANNTFDTIAQTLPSGTQSAIYIGSQSGGVAPGNITVSGNTCYDCMGFGIFLTDGAYSITGNTFVLDKYSASRVFDFSYPIKNVTISNNTGYLTPAAAANSLGLEAVYWINPFRPWGALYWNNVTVQGNTWNFPGTPSYDFQVGQGGFGLLAGQNIVWQQDSCIGCTYPDLNHGLFNLAWTPVIEPLGPEVAVTGNLVPITATIDATRERDGSEVRILNVGSQAVTFVPDSNISMGAPMTLFTGDSLTFHYVGSLGKYVAVLVSVSPGTATLYAGQTQQFSASITGSSNQQVTWSISPSGLGSITAAGLYQAPALVPSRQVVTITATAVADSTRSATASVTLEAVSVSVSPPTAIARCGSDASTFGDRDRIGQFRGQLELVARGNRQRIRRRTVHCAVTRTFGSDGHDSRHQRVRPRQVSLRGCHSAARRRFR